MDVRTRKCPECGRELVEITMEEEPGEVLVYEECGSCPYSNQIYPDLPGFDLETYLKSRESARKEANFNGNKSFGSL